MAEDIQRTRGRPQNYKQDRGGVPAEYGPYLGKVMSNIDPTRAGRLRVFIEAFADGPQDDDSKWVTVSYLPSFYGATPSSGTSTGTGTYPGNRNSYGMWFTPPDVGVTVICIFANGDRSQGFYIGVVPDQGVTHMVPAIGAAKNFAVSNETQQKYFAGATQLPVSELNVNDPKLINQPRYFEEQKPVQSVQAAIMFQQGLVKDINRGPITSSSQRETPSQVFGVSTPGRPIYQGGKTQEELIKNIDSVQPADMKVIGRLGGHTLVMDDGDTQGKDQLLRIRSAKGHQITMNDSEEFFYIVHANGQTWVEFGKEGTVDVYSTNSVNVRTAGTINLHADQDINLFAGRKINMKSLNDTNIESNKNINVSSAANLALYGKTTIQVKSDGTLAVQSTSTGSWGASALIFKAGTIDLNGPAAASVTKPVPIVETTMDDTEFNASEGWRVKPGAIKSVVTRAPTHEPYPYHNKGVNVTTNLNGNTSTPPGSSAVPAGVSVGVNG